MKLRAFLLAGLACGIPSLARAQVQADPNIIVLGQRVPIDLPPGGSDIVPAEEFENTVAVSLRDALAFSPGIYAQPRFGQEVRIAIRGSGISRGFHMRGLTLLQDGIPINMADDNGDFQELDPQVFERIEVYRGGNALRFGGSTLGGAINAVTPTGRSARGLEVRLDGGSFDTVRGKLAYGVAQGAGDAFAAVTLDRSDGDRDHAQRFALRFNGNAGLQLGEGVETRFYASINHIRQDLPGSLTLRQALTDPSQSLPANVANDQARDIDSVRLQNRTTIDAGDGLLTVGGYWNAKELYHPVFQVIDQKSNDRGVFASYDWSGQVAGMPTQIVVGTQARFGDVAARQFVNIGGKRGALVGDALQYARTVNSFAELRVTAVSGVTVVVGGVHANGWRRIDNLRDPAKNDARSYDAFSPKIGLSWRPSTDVEFYANYNRSVEFPGFGELVQSGVLQFVPLDPQRAWTIEAGTRGGSGIARWDVSVYRADLRGEMLQFTTAPTIPAATFNADHTRHQGVEASLDLALTPWARLRQVYLYSDFRFRGDADYGDNRLPVVPEHLWRGELRLGGKRFAVSPRVEWMPDGAWADYRNTVRAPGYALLGLGAEAELGRVSLFLDARNLTGKRAIGDISAVVKATPDTVAFYPVERRAIYGGLRARF
ncbi:TonB-dependent receptor [Sphingomonas sp. HF-S3]|uniref:TonB-dependent receptor n=1 Tax=Sphingomonas rustica TaxID=3103142 RepID=A0ABV0B3Y8_9SPHN